MSANESKDAEKATEGEDLLYGGPVKTKPSTNKTGGCCRCTKKKILILVIVLVMLLLYAIGLGIGLAIGLHKNEESETEAQATTESVLVPLGAVVSDHEACSQVGRDILMGHGTAVDAAIATLICTGVRTPHSMGVGGGNFMLVYDKGSGETLYFDGREIAPHFMTHEKYMELKSNNGCFMVIYDKGQASSVVIDGMPVAPSFMTHEKYTNLTNKQSNGWKIGVPGELKAYKMAHDKFGRLSWSDLFQPTIKMIRDGFPLSESTAKAYSIMTQRVDFTDFPTLCSIFCSNTTTGEGKKAGDMVYWPKMVDTLEGIAEQGPDYIYNSDLTYTLLDELHTIGSALEYRDFLMDYKAKTGSSYSVDLGNDYVLHTMPGATGGPVVAMITNILQGFNFTKSNMASLTTKAEVYHKVIEAMKFTYADRARLGDPDFVNVTHILEKMKSEEYAAEVRSKIMADTQEEGYYTDITRSFEDNMGTSHVSILSPYGDAVSVTSSINWYFGSCDMSNSSGIIWNNEMQDFTATDDATVNRVEPGKRPRSSMAPVIIVNKRTGKVKMVIGAAGGAKIANSIAQVIVKLLWLGVPLDEAVEGKRFQHTLTSKLILEQGFAEDMKEELIKKGHDVAVDQWPYMAVLETIWVDDDGVIHGHADSRKPPGQTSYMYEYQGS